MKPITVAVIGDALLDVDVLGRAERLTPDAPVPVVDVEREAARPGGAGLAALLARQDHCDVHLVTALADDSAGSRLREELRAASVATTAIPMEGETPVKRRVRSSGQSLLRLDSGGGSASQAPLNARQWTAITEAVEAADVILVADYGRGVAAHSVVRRIIAGAARTRPVVWDPHPRGGAPVDHVAVVTPNAKEAMAFAGLPLGDERWHIISAAARAIGARWSVASVIVTAGERGALVWAGTGAPTVIGANPVRGDVCGAGDRFASRLAASMGAGSTVLEAAQDAVDCASSFIAAGGVGGLGVRGSAAIPVLGVDADGVSHALSVVAETRRAGGVVVAAGGCFDLLHSGHVSALSAARSLGDCLVVCVNADESVRTLKGPGRPLNGIEDRMATLRGLSCVDAVCSFTDVRPDALLRRIRPDVWVKGGDYGGVELPEESTLAEWGGAVVTVPHLAGRSTTALVEAARAGGRP